MYNMTNLFKNITSSYYKTSLRPIAINKALIATQGTPKMNIYTFYLLN